MTRSRVGREELEFLPPGARMQAAPASRFALAVGIVIVAAFGATVAWACIGTLDVVAIARGRIVARDRNQVVQAAEGGVVRFIHVQEGASVRQGQVLVELDPTTSDADEIRLSHELVEAQLHAARLRALLSRQPVSPVASCPGLPTSRPPSWTRSAAVGLPS